MTEEHHHNNRSGNSSNGDNNDSNIDLDIEIIKARKLKELREKAAALERARKSSITSSTTIMGAQAKQQRSAREIVVSYLYDRGDEVLRLAYEQYPTQTEAIVTKIAELIVAGEIQSRISGGELLALFRSLGLYIRVDTTIRVEDHGKFVSFSDKLKQQNTKYGSINE